MMIKRVLAGLLFVLVVFTGGEAVAAERISLDDAVRAAKEFVQRQGSFLDQYREPQAVFLAAEGVWVVLFSDKRNIPPPDSDFMVKVQGETAEPLGFLGGANKQAYYQYFKKQDVQ